MSQVLRDVPEEVAPLLISVPLCKKQTWLNTTEIMVCYVMITLTYIINSANKQPENNLNLWRRDYVIFVALPSY